MSYPGVSFEKGKLVFQVPTLDGKTLPSSRKYDFKCLTCQTKFALHQSTFYEAHLQENKCDKCGKILACASRVRHHKTVKCNASRKSRSVPKKRKKGSKKKNNWDRASSSDESRDSFSDASDVVEYPDISAPVFIVPELKKLPPTCKHCREEFASAEELHLHKVCRHCEHCLQTFNCRSALQSHLPDCDRKPESSAENDASQLNTPAAVADSAEPTPEFKCQTCERTFSSELQLMTHVQVEMVQCSICRNDMHSGPEFLTHTAFRMCTGCSVSFKCRMRFDDHLNGAVSCSADTQVIKCSFCCSAQVSDAEMGTHLAENTCHCGQRFSCHALMETHRTFTHDCTEVKPKAPRADVKIVVAAATVGAPKEVCEFCGKNYHKKNDFHHRPRWCKSCSEQMPCCNMLMEHEKICAFKIRKQHECAQCGKRFCTSIVLKRHQKRTCPMKVIEPKAPRPEPIQQPEVVVVAPPKPWVYEEDFEMVPFNPFGDMYD